MPFEFTIGPLPLNIKQTVPVPSSPPIAAVPSVRLPLRAEDTSVQPAARPAATQDLS